MEIAILGIFLARTAAASSVWIQSAGWRYDAACGAKQLSPSVRNS